MRSSNIFRILAFSIVAVFFLSTWNCVIYTSNDDSNFPIVRIDTKSYDDSYRDHKTSINYLSCSLDYLDMQDGDRLVLYQSNQQYYINKQEPRKLIVVKSHIKQLASKYSHLDGSKSFYFLIADPASDTITASMLWDGIYETVVTDLFLNAMNECKTTFNNNSSSNKNKWFNIDVGANHGWFSLVSANFGFKSISFEPQSKMIYYFNQSIWINHFVDDIKVYHGAASSTLGCFTIMGRYGQGKTQLVQQYNTTNQQANYKCPNDNQIRGFVLDDIVMNHDSDNSDKSICIYKADCEGCESSAFKGSAKIFRDSTKKPKFIQIEVRKNENSRQVIDLLNSYGYFQCYIVTGSNDYTTVKGPQKCTYPFLINSNLLRGEYSDIMFF